MNLQSVPEIADGGYWYVVEAVPDPEQGGQTPGVVPGKGWCAWYANGLVAIRCPEPITGLTTQPQSAAFVLASAGYTGRPHGRIGGN